MRIFFKYFFKLIRIVVGPMLLLWDWLTSPKGVQRPLQQQQRIDEKTQHLTLYQFKSCPFCIRVRRTIKQHSLNIETRDALRDSASRKQLLEGGGKIKVPCLKIQDAQGDITWMYESAAIIHHLEERVVPLSQ
ncbi:Glutaredoxin [hydrothermal vent metagenome]|uniref:Glutaredoxin n=1 Tax=hydrothermal vent metagenome TaxID=652676 RepID=A0A3B0Z417_9ZZZZ